MKYAQPFNLKCYPKLKEYFKQRATEYDSDQFYVFEVKNVSDEINDMFRSEMEDRGLPCHTPWLLFKKQGITGENHRFSHIDTIDNVCKISIVIPIEGCEGTHMYWCEGNYHVDQTEQGQVTYGIPIWENDNEVTIAHRETIVSPTICRVDIPHETVSNLDGSYRIVVTTRFIGHPSFEEVCEKLGATE